MMVVADTLVACTVEFKVMVVADTLAVCTVEFKVMVVADTLGPCSVEVYLTLWLCEYLFFGLWGGALPEWGDADRADGQGELPPQYPGAEGEEVGGGGRNSLHTNTFCLS